MKPRPYVLSETNWKTVKDSDYQVAVLPWGATEAHNYHLPYGTDTIQTDYIAAESARKAWEYNAKVIVLPTIPFGVNTGQIDIPLTINMNPGTQEAILIDVLESLATHGIMRLVILNGHGGNDFKQMIREQSLNYPDMFIGTLDWYKLIDNSIFFDVPGDHAGEMETSNMLHIVEDLVLPLSEAGKGKAKGFAIQGLREGWAWTPRKWSSITEDTGVGDPSAANREKGKKFLDHITNMISGFLIDIAKTDPDDIYDD